MSFEEAAIDSAIDVARAELGYEEIRKEPSFTHVVHRVVGVPSY